MKHPWFLLGCATTALVGALVAVVFWRNAKSDIDDPSAVTDIRIHELRDYVMRSGRPLDTMAEALETAPADQRATLGIDGYGQPILFFRQGRRIEFRSAGPDRKPFTSDDYVLVDSIPARGLSDAPEQLSRNEIAAGPRVMDEGRHGA